MDQKLIDKIEKRKLEGTYRSLSYYSDGIDFFSNDYLGLSNLKISPNKTGRFGSTGSRLISGNSIEAIECEKRIAEFFNTEAAIVFNSGYDANIGLFSSLPQRGDTIIYDDNIHASVRDGIRLSLATSFSFKHNSIEDLRKKLNNSKGVCYVAIESLYSMDGDFAPFRKIIDLVDKFNAYIIVDEAHACGVFGRDGRGLIDALNLNDKIFARTITFGKAYGAHGACVIGSTVLIEYLVNFARSFIYTTALPQSEYERINEVIDLRSFLGERKLLHTNINYFRTNIDSKYFISEVNSPIQILRIGSIQLVAQLINELAIKNILVKGIYSPTVKEGEESIRICIHSFNTKEEIDILLTILNCFILKYLV